MPQNCTETAVASHTCHQTCSIFCYMNSDRCMDYHTRMLSLQHPPLIHDLSDRDSCCCQSFLRSAPFCLFAPPRTSSPCVIVCPAPPHTSLTQVRQSSSLSVPQISRKILLVEDPLTTPAPLSCVILACVHHHM